METYQEPVLEVIELNAAIIAASSCITDDAIKTPELP